MPHCHVMRCLPLHIMSLTLLMSPPEWTPSGEMLADSTAECLWC